MVISLNGCPGMVAHAVFLNEGCGVRRSFDTRVAHASLEGMQRGHVTTCWALRLHEVARSAEFCGPCRGGEGLAATLTHPSSDQAAVLDAPSRVWSSRSSCRSSQKCLRKCTVTLNAISLRFFRLPYLARTFQHSAISPVVHHVGIGALVLLKETCLVPTLLAHNMHRHPIASRSGT